MRCLLEQIEKRDIRRMGPLQLTDLEWGLGDGITYWMDHRKDMYVHFTRADRVDQILSSGKLLMHPPYPKFGTDTVDAVSLTFGRFLPRVQTTHTASRPDELAAIVFQSPVVPKIGSVEEVKWERDVSMRNAEGISYSHGVTLLRRASHPIESDDVVVYGPKHKRHIVNA